MLWLRVLVVWTAVTATGAINRPVYKVVLTQRGFAQFLQYDLETPPLIEFTFCTWIRLYNLANEQTIFTYIVNSRNMIRLWIDQGGRNVQFMINGWLATTSPIEMIKDVWKHVCVSYQSDYGAWALYVDARLVTCGASQAVHGFILPPGGSVNIGYGTTDNGLPSGIEGEVFGANMILISTIERNYTMKQNPRFKQRHFKRNKIKLNRGESDSYIVLNDLKENKIHNSYEITPNKIPSGLKGISTTAKGVNTLGTVQYESQETSNEREILDFAIPGRPQVTTSDPNSVQFWHLVQDDVKENLLQRNKEPFSAETKDLPSVSEFEMPPPPVSLNFNYLNQKEADNSNKVKNNKNAVNLEDLNKTHKSYELSEVEIPPPIQKDKKVYGQWVSSKFAGSVLNHLRKMRFNKKDIHPPPTIPLHKTYDAYPYASEFKFTKLKPPAAFERRSSGVQPFYPDLFSKRRPQFNVQILEDDIRDKIIKSHSRLKAKTINVVSKGESKVSHERFSREAKYTSQSSESSESIEIQKRPRPFAKSKKMRITNEPRDTLFEKQGLNKKKNLKRLLTILPFLKSLEDLIEDSDKTESKNNYKSDIYTHSLSNGNKWHNTKTFNNDYTPRQVNVESDTASNEIERKLANANNKHPAININYKHRDRNEDVELPIRNGQNLAKTVSSRAEIGAIKSQNHDFAPIQKFTYRPLDNRNKNAEKGHIFNVNTGLEGPVKINDFNKHVKLGNALNERHVIGRDETQKKRSFEGGDSRVPDINRYRSDIDKEQGNVPPSLRPKICKNVELFDRVLYIQPDESVDLTYFLSPVKLKNHAIEFIQQNYKMCSLDGSLFENDPLLYLDWSKTPVRLFGGAYLQTTTDLCGFFKK